MLRGEKNMMNSYKLYELLTEVREDNPTAVLEIIERFEPKIKKSLRQTSLQHREDLRQELVSKFLEVLYSYDTKLTK